MDLFFQKKKIRFFPYLVIAAIEELLSLCEPLLQEGRVTSSSSSPTAPGSAQGSVHVRVLGQQLPLLLTLYIHFIATGGGIGIFASGCHYAQKVSTGGQAHFFFHRDVIGSSFPPLPPFETGFTSCARKSAPLRTTPIFPFTHGFPRMERELSALIGGLHAEIIILLPRLPMPSVMYSTVCLHANLCDKLLHFVAFFFCSLSLL